MAHVKVFKLIGGEFVVSEISEAHADFQVLNNPASIITQHTETGIQVGLAPFMPFGDGTEVSLQNSAIAAYCQVDVQLLNEYNARFGSGIVLANVMPT